MAKIEIPDKLYNDIVEFCKINNIKDPESYCVDLLRECYYVEKYGDLNNETKEKSSNKNQTKQKSVNKNSSNNEENNSNDYNDIYDR